MGTFSDTLCHDCGIDVLPTQPPQRSEWYMVTDELWQQAAPEDPRWTDDTARWMTFFLCIGCLEARLGFQLKPEHFIDCPLNDLATRDNPRFAWSYRTDRLINRLGGARMELTPTRHTPRQPNERG